MKKWLPLLLCLCLLLGGCGAAEQYDIVATTAPVQQFAEAVCAGTGLTVGLVVSGSVSCLHDYTLTVRQMTMLERAKVVACSGAGLEAFLTDAIPVDAVTVDCAADLTLLPAGDHDAEHEHDHDAHDAHDAHDGHDHGDWDPHVWLDPDNAAAMVRRLAADLALRWPEHAARFSANAEAWCTRLADLKAECTAELSDLSCRELITFHDGFAYFARAFDLTILAAMEEESGSEASAKELKALTELIRSHGLPAVFVEENGSKSAAEILRRETGCAVGTLDMGMSGGDYFAVIRSNVRAVKEALA